MANDLPLIAHVIHHLHMGGMENGLVNLLNGLPADEFRHIVVCIEDHNEFAQRVRRDDVEIVDLHRSSVGVRAVRASLKRLFDERQPTVVHGRGPSALDALLPAVRARVPARLHGEHGRDVDDLAGTRMKPALLRRLHAPMVSHWVCVSGELQRYLRRRVGVSESRITHICNVVDTGRIGPAASDVLPGGFADENSVVFGTVGRAQAVKDQGTALAAFAAASQASADFARDARIAIVGDGPLLADLESLRGSLGIAPRCWLPGALEDVPAALRAMDVFVLPSLVEGISNTLLEAMATGLPLLATRVGGNVELVDDGVTGTLYPPSDVDTLRDLMLGYFKDGHRRAREGEAARRVACERFSIDAMVDQYAALYRRFSGGIGS